MADVGFRVETEVVAGGTGVAGTVAISLLSRMEWRSGLKLLDTVCDVLALALLGSRDSFGESTGCSGPSVIAMGSEFAVGEVESRTSAVAFAVCPTGSSVDPTALSKPCTRAVGHGVVWLKTMPAAKVVDGAGDFKESLFASGVTSERAAPSQITGDNPAGSWVVSCMAGGDLLDASVLAAGTCILSKTVVLVPWKKLVGAVACDGAVTVRPTCFWNTPGPSGAAAGVASRGSGEAAAFFWSSFSTIFFTHSASGSAQISMDFKVVNLKIKRHRLLDKGNTGLDDQHDGEDKAC